MTSVTDYCLHGNTAVITMNNPPVNGLSYALRKELLSQYEKALADKDAHTMVFISGGKMFCGGADVSEFNDPIVAAQPVLPDLCDLLDECPKPVIAAIHGAALGGGLELALGCDYRIASPGTQLGLPEVTLGVIPGAGGGQRLTRLTGPQYALEMVVSGRPVSAEQAKQAGFVDQVAEGDLLEAALAFAATLPPQAPPPYKTMSVKCDNLPENFFDEARARIQKTQPGLYSPLCCVDAIEAACNLPLEEGLKLEQQLFMKCLDTPQARALQHLFFAERAARKIPGLDPKTAPREIKKVAVIGAGTMGGGIAMNFANAGIPVALLETSEEALQRGLEKIRGNYQVSVKRGKLNEAKLEQRMALLNGTLDYGDIADADLVIEAVFESMDVKKQVFSKLDQICKPGAILASNTSTLDINDIAAVTQRPQDVLGLHFFSPANVMRLLEVVRGDKTAPDVLVTALSIGQRIRKLPVVVGVCFGFVGNRMLEPSSREAGRLLLEGATPQQVDQAFREFGYAMGPIAMYDLVGIDVAELARKGLPYDVSDDPSYQILQTKLCELGRYGQKTGRGFYQYNGREATPDPELIAMAEATAAELGIARRNISDKEIIERCVYSLINEGARILEEGIAYRSSDCDLVFVNGYGFPAWRGGPMQYADEIGLDNVLQGIEHYRSQLGDYGKKWFQPANLLRELAGQEKKFREFKTME